MSKGRGNFSIENVGKPFLTYVEEKQMEIDLGRSLQSENNARSTAWGTLLEEQCFNKMGLEYSLVSKVRYYHKEFCKRWSGMPDLLTDELIGDIKCPWTLKSFCKLVKIINSDNPAEALKENNPEYYWQLVSNAILCDRNKAMLVVYCPYLEDLPEVKELASGELDSRFAFINWATDEELPYLIKGKKYEDLNAVEFDIPEEDKEILTSRVKMAIELL